MRGREDRLRREGQGTEIEREKDTGSKQKWREKKTQTQATYHVYVGHRNVVELVGLRKPHGADIGDEHDA